jgi:hypothetical protein
MTSSFRDDRYSRPNLALRGTIPDFMRRPLLPGWITPLPAPAPAPIWPAPPAPTPEREVFPPALQMRPSHEVDPPEENPYNDPDFNPNFLVTQNVAAPARSSSDSRPHVHKQYGAGRAAEASASLGLPAPRVSASIARMLSSPLLERERFNSSSSVAQRQADLERLLRLLRRMSK